MFVLALVLVVLGAVVVVVGALATAHRLPRNRVIGVRTRWTMSRVDAFRRANRAAAPAFLAAGAVAVVGGVGALVASPLAPRITLLVVGLLGLLALLGVAGTVGARFAAADEAAEIAARDAASGPCTLDSSPAETCDAPGSSACGGSCALCPRAGVGPADGTAT